MMRPPWRRDAARQAPSTRHQPAAEGPADADADLLESRLTALEAELTAAVGSESLCAISRTAGSVPAAKYLEGRLAALMALRRSVRGGNDLAASLAALGAEWRRGLENVMARDAGPDWRAYRAGGVDELADLEAEDG